MRPFFGGGVESLAQLRSVVAGNSAREGLNAYTKQRSMMCAVPRLNVNEDRWIMAELMAQENELNSKGRRGWD